MKLSISNIAWDGTMDNDVYEVMSAHGCTGLEIAPTRVFPDAPYDHLKEAAIWAEYIKGSFGFAIPSMQSIWYGRTENIFSSSEERKVLISYTKKAIDFAAAIGCKNLVFGCPKNRNIPEGKSADVAITFFREIAEYATEKNTVIGMEANPVIYNTNYINDTAEALKLIKEVDSAGFRLNLDVGTMVCNNESVDLLKGNAELINHVHVSEPGLSLIEERNIHKELFSLLKEDGYDKFISIEMGKRETIAEIEKTIEYVERIL